MAQDDLHALPSLADAELTGIEWSEGDVAVHITTWEARRYTVRFREVAGMRESCALGEVADLKQRPATGAFATWCIDRTDDGSSRPRVHSYVVTDVDGPRWGQTPAEGQTPGEGQTPRGGQSPVGVKLLWGLRLWRAQRQRL